MTAVKYPKDREKLDDFYKDWYEVNKNDLADTWQRPEVYDFASKYASHVLQEYKKGLAEKIKTQPVVYAVDLIPHLTKLKEDE